MYVSIDLVEEIIERQLRKYKNKLVEKHQAGVDFNKTFVDDHDHDSVEDDSIQIIRTKRFGIKPMFQRMPAFRWNFSDIIFMYLLMRDRRGECCIQEKEQHVWSD